MTDLSAIKADLAEGYPLDNGRARKLVALLEDYRNAMPHHERLDRIEAVLRELVSGTAGARDLTLPELEASLRAEHTVHDMELWDEEPSAGRLPGISEIDDDCRDEEPSGGLHCCPHRYEDHDEAGCMRCDCRSTFRPTNDSPKPSGDRVPASTQPPSDDAPAAESGPAIDPSVSRPCRDCSHPRDRHSRGFRCWTEGCSCDSYREGKAK